MPPIAFASSNPEKFAIAAHICKKAGVPIEQVLLDIDEIQGEDPTLIIKHKAAAAFAAYGKPVIVSDDSWDIPALGGFPGAYMKSVNHWFTADDFLRLMHDIQDRGAILHQYLAYVDEHETVIFSADISGTVLDKQQGHSDRAPWMSVVTMQGDDGKSIAEVFS